MTVKELKAILEELPDDMPVVVPAQYGGCHDATKAEVEPMIENKFATEREGEWDTATRDSEKATATKRLIIY